MPSGRYKLPYEQKNCLNCNKKFEKKFNQSFKTYYETCKFCSHKCSSDYNTHTNTSLISCNCCFKKVRKKNSQITNLNFCSNKCLYEYKKNNSQKMSMNCEYCDIHFFKQTWAVLNTNHHFCSRKCSQQWVSFNLSGEKSHSWKGGITGLNRSIRNCGKMNEWRLSVFRRDGYICKECGFSKGKILQAHHVISFKQIMSENNIKTFNDALNCSFLWDISNGITLCKSCHTNKHKKI